MRGRGFRRSRTSAAVLASLILSGVVGLASPASARPIYFSNFKSFFGVPDGSNLDACGVCHFLWTGTGARNPFGFEVEQQLYLGKTIIQSLTAVQGGDADGDGFTNVDEIVNFMTLPGYSCSNFQDAINAPLGYDTYVTPLVASCLEPLDIRVDPTSLSVLVEVGDSLSLPVEVFNNGTDLALDVSDYSFLAGTASGYSVTGPALPLSIPVGSSVILNVVYAPTVPDIADGTLRVSSNDPDEPTLDITLDGFGFVKNLAPAADRHQCLRRIDRQMRRYTKSQLKIHSRCQLDQLGGGFCGTGEVAQKLAVIDSRLRAAVGGAKDKRCAGNGMTPSLLDMPSSCGGSCGQITLGSMTDVADCLICRQDDAMQQFLGAAVGSAPPDLPASTVSDPLALRCAGKLASVALRGVAKLQKALGGCEVENILAASPVDCALAEAETLGKVHAKVEAVPAKCKSTAGLEGCLFDAGADPACLGDTVEQVATDVVGASVAFSD